MADVAKGCKYVEQSTPETQAFRPRVVNLGHHDGLMTDFLAPLERFTSVV
jgi:hypothetical protein